MRTTSLALIGLLVTGCFGTQPVTHGVQETIRMVQIVTEKIPIGTPIDDARRFMELEGFEYSRKTNEPFLDRNGLDYIYCDRSDGSLIQRRWQIAVIHRDGKVSEVLASTGLVGP